MEVRELSATGDILPGNPPPLRVTARGGFTFPPQSKFVVAKVNKVCYYEFARYIKAVDTGGNSGVWFSVNFLDYKSYYTLNFLDCQQLL